MNIRTVRITDIDVGDRCRKDLGDIGGLATSIAAQGLLQPPVVTSDLRLIAGQRRLEAMRVLGLVETPVHVAVNLQDALTCLRAERDENTCREDLRLSEEVAQGERLRPLEEAEAREREQATLKRGNEKPARENFPSGDKGRTRDKVAKATGGRSGRTQEKARAVVTAAKENPALAPLVEQMDRTGKVDPAFRKLKAKQDEATLLSVKPVIGVYRTIVIDPPWDHEGFSLAGRGAPTYAVMSQEELLALPVGDWTDEQCHLYLWTTNNFLLRAGELVTAWGFEFKTVLTWVKPKFGLGTYFRSSTEHVLFAVKGDLNTRCANIGTHFEAPVGKHSVKPEEFFGIVERASYPPYLEVFARKQRGGWEVSGNLGSGG